MDKFITSRFTKEIGDFVGNQSVYDTLENIVHMCDSVCLYGNSGVGKTFTVHQVMKNKNWVDLTYELVKMQEFMDRLKTSECHIVIDDLEHDVHLIKDIFETVRSGGKLSKGSLIIIARNLTKVDFCNSVEFEPVDTPTMVTIGRRHFPKETLKRLENLACESRGNVRNFLYSIQSSDTRDTFKTPKDFIGDLLCSDSHVNPFDYIGMCIPEHGYTWDVVHENYLDAMNINSDYEYVAECMSLSDIVDTKIYNGNWELIPLFSGLSAVAPACKIQHSLDRVSLRPGSSWTKFGNFKMRSMKYRTLSNRTTNTLDVDSLMLIKTYCQKNKEKALEICKEYKLVSSDMDVINHLAIINKMKPKELHTIKKCLKASS